MLCLSGSSLISCAATVSSPRGTGLRGGEKASFIRVLALGHAAVLAMPSAPEHGRGRADRQYMNVPGSGGRLEGQK